MAILSRGKAQLTSALSVVEKWCVSNNMSLNKNKSGIMKLCLSLSKDSEIGTTIMGFPVVKEYKYLGIVFQDTGSVVAAISTKQITAVKSRNGVRTLNKYLPSNQMKAIIA